MQRKKIDVSSAEARRMRAEIVRRAFVQEGLMVAFPTCLPAASLAITADESHITALDATGEGVIYGATSGSRCHLFVANFHRDSGVVFDLGVVEGATQCPSICCLTNNLVAFVNRDQEGRAITAPLSRPPSGLIQEWRLARPGLRDLGACVPGEPISHAVADARRNIVVGATPNRLFTIDETGRIEVGVAVDVVGRLAVASAGSIVGRDRAGSLWKWTPKAANVQRHALPGTNWNDAGGHWAKDHASGLLYLADRTGRLYSFDEERGFQGPLCTVPLTPVGPMAVTFDGRLFGFCGAEMAKMFSFEPARREVRELGVAVSVIERRRYGYAFGAAITGRDGELIFGEDDNAGHLWLYFPRIAARLGA